MSIAWHVLRTQRRGERRFTSQGTHWCALHHKLNKKQMFAVHVSERKFPHFGLNSTHNSETNAEESVDHQTETEVSEQTGAVCVAYGKRSKKIDKTISPSHILRIIHRNLPIIQFCKQWGCSFWLVCMSLMNLVILGWAHCASLIPYFWIHALPDMEFTSVTPNRANMKNYIWMHLLSWKRKNGCFEHVDVKRK